LLLRKARCSRHRCGKEMKSIMASGGYPSSTANTATAPELTNDYITGPRVRRKSDGKQKFV
jgi:hypothetical protein